jgi:creatinine amidohydrolase
MRDVRWERMFRDELEPAFAACPLLYLTYGLCEPHGPQNALGLDGLKAHAIACRAAHTYGGIVAPPYFWHIHELGGEGAWSAERIGEVERTWLTAVPPWMFFKNVCYHIRTADAHGFHAAILLSGHGGPLTDDFKRIVALVQPHVGTRLYALCDSEANQPGFDNDGRSGGDHAGRVETSMIWALEPECCDISRIPRAGDTGPCFAMGLDAAEADRRIGERMAADEVRWLGAKGQELLASYDREQPVHHLRTFEDVEVLWETVVRPQFKTFRTMQALWEGQSPVPDGSVWYANWHVPNRA